MAKKTAEYKCVVNFTEGWEKRVTEAFVDLYYQRLKNGLLNPELKQEDETA